MTIFGHRVEIPPRRLNLTFNPDPAKPHRVILKTYSLGLIKKTITWIQPNFYSKFKTIE